MTFGEAIHSVFSKYATFSGRARRSEYWYYCLFNFLITISLNFLSRFIGGSIGSILSIIQLVYGLAVFIPGLAVGWRRLHDIGKSGLYCFLPAIPACLSGVLFAIMIGSRTDKTVYRALFGVFFVLTLILIIIILVWLCKDSQPGDNKYGPNPKK